MEFKIEKQNEKMIRYNYQCLAYPNAEVTCRVGYTSFSHIGNEFSLNALEQHKKNQYDLLQINVQL